jgi:hypothetical protein
MKNIDLSLTEPVSPAPRSTLQAIPVRVEGARRPGLWPSVSAVIEGFFVRYREQLVWVHVLMFLVFLAIIVLPLFLSEPAEDSGPLNNFTRFAGFAMWGLWFPLVFLSVVFSGRSWCGLLCPMGAASEWANKKGLQRAIPAWARPYSIPCPWFTRPCCG